MIMKKYILVAVLGLWSLVFGLGMVYGQGNGSSNTQTCSAAQRSSNPGTWYNNTASCGNGNWTPTESTQWTNFWSAVQANSPDQAEKNAASIAKTAAGRNITLVKSQNIQGIISKYCGA
jgi:hypothetical protein